MSVPAAQFHTPPPVWQEGAGPTPEQLAHRDPEGLYSPDAPLHAPLTAARWLTSTSSGDRKVLHCELGIEGSGARPHPGDSLGVRPANPPALVEALLARLGLERKAVFNVRPMAGAATQHLLPHLHTPCSVGHAFLVGSLGPGCCAAAGWLGRVFDEAQETAASRAIHMPSECCRSLWT